jgi:hypothetical protein
MRVRRAILGKEGRAMTLVADKPLGVQPGPKHWYDRLLVPEMWGTLAISVMWLAVLLDGLYGADIVGFSNDGNSTRIPSAVAVAFFAFLGTAAVAKRAFGRKTDSDRT